MATLEYACSSILQLTSWLNLAQWSRVLRPGSLYLLRAQGFLGQKPGIFRLVRLLIRPPAVRGHTIALWRSDRTPDQAIWPARICMMGRTASACRISSPSVSRTAVSWSGFWGVVLVRLHRHHHSYLYRNTGRRFQHGTAHCRIAQCQRHGICRYLGVVTFSM